MIQPNPPVPNREVSPSFTFDTISKQATDGGLLPSTSQIDGEWLGWVSFDTPGTYILNVFFGGDDEYDARSYYESTW